jgi:UDP-GlcNAc:undecaprenyl-phosphate GlcNAc-1-phosphate transferase
MSAAHWQSGLTTFIAVLFLVPLVRVFCTQFRLYDLPGPLKIHMQPVPRLGGVAITLAMLLGVTAASLSMARGPGWLLLLAAALVWMSGLIDDVRGLHPAIRLSAQILAGLLLVRAGWTISLSGNAAIDAAATCLYVVLLINAFNFLDGADGIAAGVAAIIAIGYIARPNMVASALEHSIAWCLLGACAGFLLFNFPPANVFMGDSGSSMLGFAIALLGLAFYQHSGPVKLELSPILFSMLVAALPLFDACLAVLRRLRSRSSPLYGDRRHFYDLLLARGWSARQVALICYVVTAGLVCAAWFILWLGGREALVASALVGCSLFAMEVRLGALRSEDDSRGECAKKHLGWREVVDHGLRGKI